MITQEDRDARNNLLKLIDCIGDDNDSYRIDRAFAAHRIAAEKVVLDRLLTRDAAIEVLAQLARHKKRGLYGVEAMQSAIADILEQQP